jgi:hypothetical protein
MLSEMKSLFSSSALPNRSLLLWLAWWRAVHSLRPACHRCATFLWLAVVLAAFCLRPDLAGVTSLVRSFRDPDPSHGFRRAWKMNEPVWFGHSCCVWVDIGEGTSTSRRKFVSERV